MGSFGKNMGRCTLWGCNVFMWFSSWGTTFQGGCGNGQDQSKKCSPDFLQRMHIFNRDYSQSTLRKLHWLSAKYRWLTNTLVKENPLISREATFCKKYIFICLTQKYSYMDKILKQKGNFSMFHLEWRKILLTNLDNLQMGDFLEIIVQLWIKAGFRIWKK